MKKGMEKRARRCFPIQSMLSDATGRRHSYGLWLGLKARRGEKDKDGGGRETTPISTTETVLANKSFKV